MPAIDIHTHVTPERYKKAIRETGEWHGLKSDAGELDRGGFSKPLAERLEEMDAMGIDLQLVTPSAGFSQYANELGTTKVIARECNDEVAEMVEQFPSRFAGLGTLPMQDVSSAVAELERVMRDLHLKGVMISDHVNDLTYDDPQFLPFFQAAEALGAIVFFHQSSDTCVSYRIRRYGLGNAVGNLTERTLVFATLVFGGVMDKCPNLKPLLAHGGGYVAYGIGRLDKIAGALEGGYPETGLQPPFGRDPNAFVLPRPPSEYLGRFYYDCCTYNGPALRFLIDAVGIDRVMLGTDYPAPMVIQDPVTWVNQLDCLEASEKEAILYRNPAAFLDQLVPVAG